MRTSIDRFQLLRGDLSGRRRGIRPPWSQPESLFTDLCQRCAECTDACPTHIIENGAEGFPLVNFSQGHCTFCGDCVKACKHQALTFPTELTTPPWALDVTIDGSCLSINGVVCRSCGDICEESAIRFKLETGGRSTPLLDQLSCSGCGECVSVCPSHSITITPTQQEHAA
ncbi:MAG: ferredoxin-type protein NapF [Candidatus Thiodiazotropha sp. (ex Lucinoma borealis)]|nr:ferredoxin-type protein NapF [Candidatus Thiodiazotropha sp. (ex Lucinoma borealis)]